MAKHSYDHKRVARFINAALRRAAKLPTYPECVTISTTELRTPVKAMLKQGWRRRVLYKGSKLQLARARGTRAGDIAYEFYLKEPLPEWAENKDAVNLVELTHDEALAAFGAGEWEIGLETLTGKSWMGIESLYPASRVGVATAPTVTDAVYKVQGREQLLASEESAPLSHSSPRSREEDPLWGSW